MSREMTGSERRRAPRVPISLQVQKKEGEDFVGFGYAKDLSEMGLNVEGQAFDPGKTLPKTGEEVELRFKLPKGNLFIRAAGVLVRVDKGETPCLAIEFKDLEKEVLKEIRTFIAQGST